MEQFEYVPVFMVYIWDRETIVFVKDGLKGTTTDTEEAHCFLFENAACKYIELLQEKQPDIMAHPLRVYVNLENVKMKKYHGPIERKLLDIWEKIKKRVWK